MNYLALGKFAVGNFAAGKFAAGKIRRWENSPMGKFAARKICRADFFNDLVKKKL